MFLHCVYCLFSLQNLILFQIKFQHLIKIVWKGYDAYNATRELKSVALGISHNKDIWIFVPYKIAWRDKWLENFFHKVFLFTL